MSLASRLPFRHAYSAGFPGLGSQAVPTDADALDYLDRMAAADGASVEVGVATAVDAFFRDLKATPGLFDAIKASCILCGARTLAGALVPVVGDAPTNLPVANGFVSGDYSRTAGLTGDQASYLDSGRAGDDDPQNDQHFACWVSSAASSGTFNLMGTDGIATAGGSNIYENFSASSLQGTSRSVGDGSAFIIAGGHSETGLKGLSRSSPSSYIARAGGSNVTVELASEPPTARNYFVFARNDATSPPQFVSDATIAFYSIGTSLGTDPGDGLAALDTAVSNLINAIGEAL